MESNRLANSQQEMGDERMASALSPFGVAVDHRLAEQLRAYTHLLLQWNEKVGLTTITDPQEILERHFGESFFGARMASVSHGRLADVGSGAGFPGLAIKILVPDLDVVLIEPDNRKATFLGEVVRELGISGVRIERSRFEELRPSIRGFDYVCSRAVGETGRLLTWCVRVLSREGKLILWVGAQDAQEVAKSPGWLWYSPFSIPRARRRVILVGCPTKE